MTASSNQSATKNDFEILSIGEYDLAFFSLEVKKNLLGLDPPASVNQKAKF